MVVPAPILFDEFDRYAMDTANWNQTTVGLGGIIMNDDVTNKASYLDLATGGAGAGEATIWGTRQFPLSSGRLILIVKCATYTDPGIYGNGQPRGLAAGYDRSNAIEFISYSSTQVAARTVSGGAVTQTIYPLGSSVYVMHHYMIDATSTVVKFYIDGVLMAVHTTNIPTLPLNPYIGTTDGGLGNVPIELDYVSFSIAY